MIRNDITVTKSKSHNFKKLRRSDIANRIRFQIFDLPEYFDYVKKHFFDKLEFEKLDRLDRCIVNKIAHWFEFYIGRIIELGSTNRFSHIPQQLIVVLCVSAIESTIGIPKGENPSKLIYEFFENNLTNEQKKELLESIEFHKKKTTIKNISEFIINKRNGFMHRCELISLPQGIDFAGLSTSDKRGRLTKGGAIVKLSPRQLVDIVKIAIKKYLLTNKKERLPKQNFRLINYKKRKKIIS